jgi:hypothetical protein
VHSQPSSHAALLVHTANLSPHPQDIFVSKNLAFAMLLGPPASSEDKKEGNKTSERRHLRMSRVGYLMCGVVQAPNLAELCFAMVSNTNGNHRRRMSETIASL